MRIYAFYLVAVVALMAVSSAHAEAVVPDFQWSDAFWKMLDARFGTRFFG